ncbi:hypothetical protein VTK26DRAFT_880 [Humicola hyalothermophila]
MLDWPRFRAPRLQLRLVHCRSSEIPWLTHHSFILNSVWKKNPLPSSPPEIFLPKKRRRLNCNRAWLPVSELAHLFIRTVVPAVHADANNIGRHLGIALVCIPIYPQRPGNTRSYGSRHFRSALGSPASPCRPCPRRATNRWGRAQLARHPFPDSLSLCAASITESVPGLVSARFDAVIPSRQRGIICLQERCLSRIRDAVP